MKLPGSEAARTRFGLVFLMAVAALLLFVSLGAGGLTDPDESAYAESVREMTRLHDWLVPHLYGHPLLDKPILYYWILGSFFRLLGRSEFAARLPSALAALALLLVVYRLALRIHGRPRTALVASLCLATSLEFVMLGRAAVTDMILTLFCTLAILGSLEALHRPERRLLPLASALFAGLAVLTKGPVGLFIPASVVGSYLLATRSLGRLRDLRPAASLLVFGAVSVPWYAAIGLLRPDLVEGFFISGNLGRFLSAEHRPEPPLYYLVVLTIGFLPWSVFLPEAMGRVFTDWRRGGGKPSLRLLPLLWLLILLVFFTVAASKLPSYILPALPAAAILASEPLESWLRPPQPGRRLPGTGAAIALTLLAGGMALFAWKTSTLGSVPMEFKTALLPVCLAAFIGTLVALGVLLAGWSRISYFLLLCGNGVLIFCLLIFGFPELEPWKSSRDAARTAAIQLTQGDGVILYRENHPGFAFYLDRVPELVRKEDELVTRLQSRERLVCLMGRDRYEKLRVRRQELALYLLRNSGQTVVVSNFPPGTTP
jgi:4-amino-4-deoxy-L-arabinose transferase-like glycosyltransferase